MTNALALPSISEEDLIKKIISLAPADLPGVTLHIRALRETLKRLEDVAEASCGDKWSEIGLLDGAWKSPDGSYYKYHGAFKREVADPDGLRAALVEAIKEKQDTGAAPLLRDAFRVKTEVLQTPLSTLEKMSSRYEDIIKDFRRWHEGPKHLTKIETTAKERK